MKIKAKAYTALSCLSVTQNIAHTQHKQQKNLKNWPIH